MIRAALWLLVGAAFLASACGLRPEPRPAASPAVVSATRQYKLVGTIRSLDAKEREAVVAHEEIPGFMAAMTMPFRVRDEASFNALRPGDEITADLFVSDDATWLDGIVVRKQGAPDAGGAPAPAIGPKRGDPVPDVTLVDQDGSRVRFSELRGKAVAFTFIFTRCPLPEFCPRMADNFAAVEKALVQEPALQSRTQLLSISFDTAFDKPEVLKKYGKRYQPGPDAFRHWRLLTGTKAAVKTLATFAGLEYEEESGQFTHNLRTAVVTPDGAIFRVYRGNDWRPEELVADLRNALSGQPAR